MRKSVEAPKGFHWMKSGKGFKLMKNPIGAQSAFVSVVMGVMTGVFGIWMGHEHRGDTVVEKRTPRKE